jgi:hypothetical protein
MKFHEIILCSIVIILVLFVMILGLEEFQVVN